ncbi:MAG: hypothetical protein IIB42_08045 [Candidatus Marinimicrobia bacterium]|nr:hypothetical protein [Candidatus Neomarinimicrobiota bacterium]
MMGCAGPRVAHRRSAIHTGYAYVFLAARAERIEDENLTKARKLYRRANKHYTKAYQAGLKRLEKRHPGFNDTLTRNPGAAAAMATRQDVPLLYWTAASLGAAIGLSKDQPRMLIRLPQVGSLAFRVTELWPDYMDGAAYELLMVYEASRPAMMGGSIALAKHYYEQALTHSKGNSASLFVGFGENICVQEQDREAFVAMMDRALAVKAGGAANRVARKRARWFLSRIDDLFL